MISRVALVTVFLLGAGQPAVSGDVHRFGAVGDGTADDTAAIQRAVDSKAGRIVLPRGVYRLTRPVVVDLDAVGYTSIEGGGVARVVMAGAGPAFRFVGTHFRSADPGGFTDAVWDRQRMPLVDGLAIVGAHAEAVGIEAIGTMQLTITRTHVRGALHGIRLAGNNRNVVITDCHIYENRGVGIYYDDVNLHQSNITGCHISYNAGGGVVSRAGNVRNIHITGCDIESNMSPDTAPTANVLIDSRFSRFGTGEVAITGCTIQHNDNSPGSANIRVLGQSGGVRGPWPTREGHVTITGNVLSDVKVNVHLRGCRGAVLAGNTMWQGYEQNILIESCTAVVVGANVLDRNPRYERVGRARPRNAVVIRDSEDCTITGLHLSGVSPGPGLHVSRSRRVAITGCSILDCDDAGVRLDEVAASRVTGCVIRNDRPDARSTPLIVTGTGELGNFITDNLIVGQPEIAAGAGIVRGNDAPPAPPRTVRPIALHPENRRIFLWRDEPTLLVTSGEHYGALLNLDFDYRRYFETLRRDGLNHTRVFSGVYREVPGSFGITDNTLAPRPNRFICPWARSDTPGYFDGGNKFDLTRWDPEYFSRLRDFMSAAREHGIVVELTLFCPMYRDELWTACPMNAANNVNGIGRCDREEVYTLKHADLLLTQLAVARKLVSELRDFDNLYFEVCNEPYFGGVTMEWQRRIVDAIVEADGPARHLISINVANGQARVTDPHPAVSIFNFHYCVPPDTVALNWDLERVIGENETGFRGKADVLYRTEGWDFLMAGGALYNNLDYSFTPAHPDGTLRDYASPGGGSPELRRQLGILKDFLHRLDLVRLRPDRDVVKRVDPPDLTVSALAAPGAQYAVYLHVPIPKKPENLAKHLRSGIEATLTLDLPEGTYAVEWVDTKTGSIARSTRLEHAGGIVELGSPKFDDDIAVRVVRP